MKAMEALLAEADELLAQGEAEIKTGLTKGYQLLRQAINNLCQAYLITNAQEPLGDLKALFFQCVRHNPEFEMIEEAVAVFTDPGFNGLDSETLIDAANEIWDFIAEMLPV